MGRGAARRRHGGDGEALCRAARLVAGAVENVTTVGLRQAGEPVERALAQAAVLVRFGDRIAGRADRVGGARKGQRQTLRMDGKKRARLDDPLGAYLARTANRGQDGGDAERQQAQRQDDEHLDGRRQPAPPGAADFALIEGQHRRPLTATPNRAFRAGRSFRVECPRRRPRDRPIAGRGRHRRTAACAGPARQASNPRLGLACGGARDPCRPAGSILSYPTAVPQLRKHRT